MERPNGRPPPRADPQAERKCCGRLHAHRRVRRHYTACQPSVKRFPGPERSFERSPRLCVTKTRRHAKMHFEHAEHTLETIRTLMEPSQRYEHGSGCSGLVAGSVVLAACGVLEAGRLPFGPRVNFALVWSAAFVVAFLAHATLTFAPALLPSLLASFAASVLMWRLN